MHAMLYYRRIPSASPSCSFSTLHKLLHSVAQLTQEEELLISRKGSRNLDSTPGAYPSLNLTQLESLHTGSRIQDASPVYASCLRKCTELKALGDGRCVHAHIRSTRFSGDVYLSNLLIQMYGSCGAVQDARSVFVDMRDRNVFTWAIMIGVCAQTEEFNEALQLFQQMHIEGVVPDRVTLVQVASACCGQEKLSTGKRLHASVIDRSYEFDLVFGTALVTMYGKCSCADLAQNMFDTLPEPNAVRWNAVIAACAQNGKGNRALTYFQQMQIESVLPDHVSFISAVDACGSATVLVEGKKIHTSIVSNGFEIESVIGNALVNMYGKLGKIKIAQNIFDSMPTRNIDLWNSILAAYGKHRKSENVIRFFEEMLLEGVKPDAITFFIVLSACSHTALIEEGRSYFNGMSQDHGVTPSLQHYNCMIDLLGRAGMLDEMEKMVRQMPLPPDRKSWMSVLNACRIHSDVLRGERIAEHVFQLFPGDPTFYVVLLNIYMEAGRFEGAAMLKKKMKDEDIELTP